MISNTIHLTEINSPKQKIQSIVELYRGSTVETTCTCSDILGGFTVERVGEGNFFGFGIVHALKVSLIDVNRELAIDSGNTIRVAYVVNENKVYPYPTFHIKPDGIERDETTNTLTITAFDSLGVATEHTFSELNLMPPYTYAQVATACKNLLGIGTLSTNTTDGFNTSFNKGANFDGSETIREVLNAIAEATQTIYCVKAYGVSGTLRFKKINKDAAIDYEIGRNKYFSLKTSGAAMLGNICHATELGDNVISDTGIDGVTQYVRNNPFWETIAESGDIGATVDAAADKMCGTSIAQFESEWSGNYLLEPLDKISLEAENGSSVIAYILDDVIHYDGTLSETTRWQYVENDAETFSNPSNLGDALKQTFAKVDKVNKEISLVVSTVDGHSNELASLQAYTDYLNSGVNELEQSVEIVKSDIFAVGDRVSAVQVEIDRIDLAVGELSGDVSSNAVKLSELEINTQGIYGEVTEVRAETDKLNGMVSSNTMKISDLELTAEVISASVANTQTNLDNAISGVNNEINTLTTRVDASMTSTEVQLQISTALTEQGAAKVETTTGYTFNESGLHISKSGSGVENLIDNTGMYVKRDGTDILVANTDGVEATNLHAKTYLIIGRNSRFEDYDDDSRTGCFFIGG